MLSLLFGLIGGFGVGAALNRRELKKEYFLYLPLFGLLIGAIVAMVLGMFWPHELVVLKGEYPLRAINGSVYVIESVSKGTFIVNTGVEGFDSEFLKKNSELVFDSSAEPTVAVYYLGHTGALKQFTFVPIGLTGSRINVPDAASVKKIP